MIYIYFAFDTQCYIFNGMILPEHVWSVPYANYNLDMYTWKLIYYFSFFVFFESHMCNVMLFPIYITLNLLVITMKLVFIFFEFYMLFFNIFNFSIFSHIYYRRNVYLNFYTKMEQLCLNSVANRNHNITRAGLIIHIFPNSYYTYSLHL